MISHRLARFRRELILGSALTLGVGLASWQNSALAGVSEQGYAKDVPYLTSDARASGAIVVAENDGDDNGDDKKHPKGKNANRDNDNRHGDGGGDNSHRNGGNNGNWNNNGNGGKYGDKGDHDGNGDNGHWKGGNNDNWKKYGNKGDHDGNDDNGHWKGGNNDNWKKGDHDVNENWSKNGYQHWSQNHKNYGNGWSGYHNNWNKNWDRRAYVRNWNPEPYYGEFIGGVFLGSILAANGVGVVPYAPEPYLCWYWADPYMIRGYWDYCY